jgi:hypothetical protein
MTPRLGTRELADPRVLWGPRSWSCQKRVGIEFFVARGVIRPANASGRRRLVGRPRTTSQAPTARVSPAIQWLADPKSIGPRRLPLSPARVVVVRALRLDLPVLSTDHHLGVAMAPRGFRRWTRPPSPSCGKTGRERPSGTKTSDPHRVPRKCTSAIRSRRASASCCGDPLDFGSSHGVGEDP